MREDERQPLSKAALQKQIRKEAKFSAGFSVIPLLFAALPAILFTVIVSHITEAPPFFWGFLVMGVIPLWAAVAVLAHGTVKAFMLYRRRDRDDLVEIVTDRVCDLTEESELHRSCNAAYQDRAYVVYLAGRGRCVIDSTLWNILKEGDGVYVAVTLREKRGVHGVYSAKTHRIVDP